MSALKCTRCEKADLFVAVGFDGLDGHSEAGEGSGYKCTVELTCPHCGAVYIVGRVKHYRDFALDTDANHFAYEGQETKPVAIQSMRHMERS